MPGKSREGTLRQGHCEAEEVEMSREEFFERLKKHFSSDIIDEFEFHISATITKQGINDSTMSTIVSRLSELI